MVGWRGVFRVEPTGGSNDDPRREREELDYSNRSGLIYCGLCGALNPSSNHYCARCGSTLVDAFHATEGLRVFQHPDDASRLVQIVPAGTELEALPDDDAPADYIRVKLRDGRLGYVKQSDLNAVSAAIQVAGDSRTTEPADINTNARGCVTPGAALGAIGLILVLSVFLFLFFNQGREQDTGIIALFFCITFVPILAILIGLYISARAREDRRLEEEEERG
jgi:hypothetical protein